MVKGLKSDRRGVSQVITSLILAACVIIVGTAVWGFSHSMTSQLQTSYFEGVSAQMDLIRERFAVEHLSYIDGTLHVWVYNFGEVDVEVDVYVKGEASGSNATAMSIMSGSVVDIRVPLSASKGNELVIDVISRRQNVVSETYVTP